MSSRQSLIACGSLSAVKWESACLPAFRVIRVV
jgi:hypothetical protein